MPISGYFDIPFAVGGDLTPIPDPAQISGAVSYEQGFPILYSTPVGSGGLDFPRAQFNQLMNDVTTAIQLQQQGLPAPFITSTMNGGSPYSYPAYASVISDGVGYISLMASNTDVPPSAKWATIPLGSSAFLQKASNLSDVANSGTALSNLGGLSTSAAAATYLSIASAASTYLTQSNAASTYETQSHASSTYAPINNANLTGIPTVPTASTGTANSQAASTAFVSNSLLPTPGAVGSWVIASIPSGTLAIGGTIAGSSLSVLAFGEESGFANYAYTGHDTITGTWRAMQSVTVFNGIGAGIFQRIA